MGEFVEPCPECGKADISTERGRKIHISRVHGKKAAPVKAKAKVASKVKEESLPLTDALPEVHQADPESASAIVIHFIEDGFTALGKMWFRGEELRLERDSAEFGRTKDVNGDSWMDMDPEEQMRRHGREIFRKGPWPYLGWEAALDEAEALYEDDPEMLATIEKQRQQMNHGENRVEQRRREKETYVPGIAPSSR